ncbi:hypothetical protein GE300_13615 [Rhodobacteraceae bacterium 2CG4]|uniref:O-antigen/teichoic acid export membrane protein n=1 Tax=Halovulum marinum TaxID=2662447 RepID=A0A6L5Z299_9RHOB|nr:hypothetical protein [Halovulum marinum]MSU90638.1 hypothetical protein [Halovulum marinum]
MTPEWRRAALSAAMGAAQGVAAAAGALAALLLSRQMGAAGFGQAMLLVSAATLGAVVAGANLEGAAIRVLNSGPAWHRAAFVRFNSRVIALGSGLIMLVCAAAWRLDAVSAPAALALAAAAPALALLRATARQGAALGAPGGAVAVRILARPLAFLAFAGLCLALSLRPPDWALAALLAAACGVGVLLQRRVLRPVFRALPPAPRAMPGSETRGWLRIGLVLAPSLLVQEMFRDLVLVSAAPVLAAPQLGLLALALTLAALPGLAVAAVEIATGPRIARLAAAGAAGLPAALAEAARLRLLGLGLALPGLALVLAPALQLAGATGGHALVWALAAVPALRALLGNPALLLTAAGHAATVGGLSAVAAALTGTAVAGGAIAWGTGGAVAGAVAGAGAAQALMWGACLRRTGQDCSARAALMPGRRLVRI